MASTFRRRAATKGVRNLAGTRAWKQTIVTSSGIRSFDDILGRGQPLQSALAVAEDPYCDRVLSRYWVAEVGFRWEILRYLTDLHDLRPLLMGSSW